MSSEAALAHEDAATDQEAEDQKVGTAEEESEDAVILSMFSNN